MNTDKLTGTLRLHALWLARDPLGVRANLSGANLRGANLTKADLTKANLTKADLTWADLTRADLTGADLTRADLTGADLTKADLTRARLAGADLTKANLTDAVLTGANLRWANLTGADLRAIGNTRELRTMQIDRWAIGYTHDTLQIGCQRHPISKWAEAWASGEAGRKWVARMDSDALAWPDRNLSLVLQIIAANPADPRTR